MAIKFLNTVAVDTDVLYVDASSNNVGIGTTSPGVKLDVDGTIRVSQPSKFQFANGQYIKDDGDAGLDIATINSVAGITFITNSSDRMKITSSGEVGIGTTNPQRKLHVNGAARIQGNGQTLDLVGTDHSYIGFYPDGAVAGRKAYIGFPGSTSDRLTISNEFNDDISFFTNGSEKVTIENSGDVGIGTRRFNSRS
jgi:hypothetical protein